MSRETWLSNKYVKGQMVNILNTERALVNHQKKKKAQLKHKEQHINRLKKSQQLSKNIVFGMLYSTNTSQINANQLEYFIILIIL